jgi:hypothetical protein
LHVSVGITSLITLVGGRGSEVRNEGKMGLNYIYTPSPILKPFFYLTLFYSIAKNTILRFKKY